MFSHLLQEKIIELYERHMATATKEERGRKDSIAHFVLRLAYCRTGACAWLRGVRTLKTACSTVASPVHTWHIWIPTLPSNCKLHTPHLPACAPAEDLRRWLIAQECDLFRARFKLLPASDQVRQRAGAAAAADHWRNSSNGSIKP